MIDNLYVARMPTSQTVSGGASTYTTSDMVESRIHLVEEEQTSLDREKAEPHKSRYRWVMLVLLWLLYAVFGLVSRAIAPLVTPILNDLHISYAQMGLILGSWPLTYILVALIAGTIIDKWGVRKSLLAGAVIIALSATLRYFPNGFATMLIVVALFGVGGSMISIGGPKAISLWFRGRSRGTAVGIYMTGPWVGGLLALTITNSFIMPLTGYSWRLTFVCYGLLTLSVALLWWLLARDAKPAATMPSAGLGEVFSKLVRTRNVQVLLIMGLLSFATMHGFMNWLPKILEGGGLSPVLAGFAASIPLAAGIPATLVIPRLVPAHLRGRFVASFALLTAVTLFVVATAQDAALLAGLVLYGIAYSCFLPFQLLILMDTPEVDSRYMGSAGGMFFCVAEIGGFTGPLIMGILVDMTGTFLAGVFFLMSLSLAIIAMTLFLKTKPISPKNSSP